MRLDSLLRVPAAFCTGVAVSVVIALTCAPAVAQPITFVLEWGSSGTAAGQFNTPYGVAVDGSGNVYIADTGNSRIQKFSSSGSLIMTWGSLGGGDGEFNLPFGVAVDSSGNVYVADSANSRIQKFTSAGVFVTKWTCAPYGVAVDGAGNVYVAEFDNHRIQKFTSNGAFITNWGFNGTGDGAFDHPFGIGVDGSSNVYVVDFGNHRIQKFTSSGAFITKWGSNGNLDGQFNAPDGIAVDSAGKVYVADTSNHRIQKFTSAGVFVTKWGTSGSGPGQFLYPSGIAVDGSNNLFVADTYNDRVQKFADGSECFLFLGFRPADIPITPGDHLYVDSIVHTWEVLVLSVPTLHIPLDPELNGKELYFQVALFNERVFPTDPLKMSNGLKVTIGGTGQGYGKDSGLLLWAATPARIGQDFKVAFRAR